LGPIVTPSLLAAFWIVASSTSCGSVFRITGTCTIFVLMWTGLLGWVSPVTKIPALVSFQGTKLPLSRFSPALSNRTKQALWFNSVHTFTSAPGIRTSSSITCTLACPLMFASIPNTLLPTASSAKLPGGGTWAYALHLKPFLHPYNRF
jgi:hypothetical protein